MSEKDDKKRDRSLKLMKVDREIIREQLNILVQQAYIEKKKKFSRSEALDYHLRKYFENDSGIIAKLDAIEKKRIVNKK